MQLVNGVTVEMDFRRLGRGHFSRKPTSRPLSDTTNGRHQKQRRPPRSLEMVLDFGEIVEIVQAPVSLYRTLMVTMFEITPSAVTTTFDSPRPCKVSGTRTFT